MVTGHFTVFEGRQRNREDVSGALVLQQARRADDRSRDPPDVRRRPLPRHAVVSRSRIRSASLEIVVNPLVNWIWIGFAVMALGTGIVLLPERTFAFAHGQVPGAEAATTAGMLLLMLQSRRAGAGAARRERRPRAGCDLLAIRARAAARDHLHVRHLRRGRILRNARAAQPQRCARRSQALSRKARRDDEIIRHVHRQVRQPGTARGADRQGLQSPRVVLSVCGRRLRRRCRRVRRQKVVAALARRAADAAIARSPLPKTRHCRRGSIASSKTSISPLPPTQPTSDSATAVAVLHARRARVRDRRGLHHSRHERREPHLRLSRHLLGCAGRSGGAARAATARDGRDARARDGRAATPAWRSSARRIWCSARSRSSSSITRWGRSASADYDEMAARLRSRAVRLHGAARQHEAAATASSSSGSSRRGWLKPVRRRSLTLH